MQTSPLCPRCHFRLPPGAHICRTCGHTFVSKKENVSSEQATPRTKPASATWDNVFNLGAKKEQRHDEPALGES